MSALRALRPVLSPRGWNPARRAGLLGLIALGFLLRLIRLDVQPLWWDEGYSVWFAGQAVAEMVRLTAADIHPPLYYALLHGWSLVLGLTPAALRLFGVLISLPAIPLAYRWGYEGHSPRTGMIAAALVAIHPLAVFYAQEVRMYGLAMTFSLAALWSGWRWARMPFRTRWGLVYGLSVLGGLYTLYTFALLPLAQGLMLAVMPPRRWWRRRLAPLMAAGLLYLPWLVYAGPRLRSYVAYKVVLDNDTPLGLLPYLGRHLSAFLVGHLEGPAAVGWPWAWVVGLLPLYGLAWAWRRDRSVRPVLLYATLCLVVALGFGFAQQLRAPFLPERFERVLLFAAPALWLLLALGLVELARAARSLAWVAGGALGVAAVASLVVFYTTPRYSDRDYRPLIAMVAAEMRATDHIFTVFPWQTGYFWAYLPSAQRRQVVLTPATTWGPTVQTTLDALLAQGALWFPEHLALGAILESAVEDYLDRHSYQLLNRWFNPETRLTAWVLPSAATTPTALTVPWRWQNGIRLVRAGVQGVDGQGRLLLSLEWVGEAALNPADLTYSLGVYDPQGVRRAQRDVNPFAHPWPALSATGSWRNSDRLAIGLPPGLPPGDYELRLDVLDAMARPIPLSEAGLLSARLGIVHVPTDLGAAVPRPAYPAHVAATAIGFYGHNRPPDPYLPGDDIPIELFWRPRTALTPDRFLFLQLLDRKGQVVAAWEGPPVPWYPTSRWSPDGFISSWQSLRVPATLPPGRYRLIAGLFDPGTGARIRWGRHEELTLGWVRVGARSHTFTAPRPSFVLDRPLAGGHRLVGYDLSADGVIHLTLYWQPAGPTDIRYSVFVHLVAADGTLLAQSDAEPAGGALPTTAWLPGEFVTDLHTLTLPSRPTSPPAHLAVGLYDPHTGRRLPFLAPDGSIVGDHWLLPLP
jgi:4-amino-4-deoxy-L-arabinose transferase-like glycosyltransferase